MSDMHAAATKQNWGDVARGAHWLKGAGGSVGYGQLTSPAQLLERHANKRDGEAVLNLLDYLQSLVHELLIDAPLADAAPSVSAPSASVAPPVSVATLNAESPAIMDAESKEPTVEQTPRLESSETRPATILVVDDEPFNIRLVEELLSGAGPYRIVSTTDGCGTLPMALREQPDVVLLDLNMPTISGFDCLTALRATPGLEQLPVLIFTASDDRKTRLRALDLGATDFIAKPVERDEILPRVRNAVLMKRHLDELRIYAHTLESQVLERTQQLERSRRNAIYCLARAAEFRDDDTGRHVLRVGAYAAAIARRLGWTPTAVARLQEAAQLHDVGKIGIPDSILLKPGKLSDEEYAVMQKHCGYGKAIFERMSDDDGEVFRKHAEMGNRILMVDGSPLLDLAATIALTHHERVDGSGYPLGLAGEDIPLVGRIVAIADVFDALSSKRCYKPAFSMEKCWTILEEGRGTLFDSASLDAFFSAREDILAIKIQHADVD
jgi:putative two-component system response regulator